MLAIRIRPLRQSNYDAMIELFQMSGLNPKTKGRDSPRMFAEQLRRNRGAYLGAFDGGDSWARSWGRTTRARPGSTASRSIPNIVVGRSGPASYGIASASSESEDSRCSPR